MSVYSYKTIMLKGQEFASKEESGAGEAGIYPGHFLEIAADGDFELQDEGDTVGPLLIAVEDDMEGKTIDDVYTSGRRVQARWVPIGAEVFTWLAAGHNTPKSGPLAFAGYDTPGCLGVAQYSSGNLGAGARFIAKEAVDNSLGVTAVRIVAQRVN